MKTIQPITIHHCYYCEGKNRSHVLRENGFNLVKCDECGVIYCSDRPSETTINESTRSGIHEGEQQLHVNVRYNPRADKFYEHVINKLFPNGFKQGSVWMDIGCGYGEFLETLDRVSNSKLVLKGSEPNITKQNMANKLGWDVTFFDMEKHDKQYDYVSLLNVYSHLSNPVEFLKDFCGLVKTGGSVIIQTGDATGIDASNILTPAGLPDHLTFVPQKVLEEILTKNGFEITQVEKFPSVPFTPKRMAMEFAKIFLPSRQSFFKHYFNGRLSAANSMFVMARKK
jgi:2-polyprenyl-3-methyl-5-hydroxy-6-metoxy-1,4-benzoquinol methylase